MRPMLLIPILGALAMVPATAASAGGCGGCGAAAPVLYAQPPVAPVLYAQPAPAPTIYAWPAHGAASCGGCATYGHGYGHGYSHGHTSWAKQPIYVVNQGPVYSGAGIMVPTLTWSKSRYTGGYPYVGGHPGWYDGGPYADPMGHRYVRRYGYHEQIPAGYSVAPHGPRIITRGGYAPRYGHGHYAPRYGHGPRYAPAYLSPKSPRVYGPRHRPVVVRANAEVRHVGRDRIDVRLYRAPKKNRYHGY